MLNELSIVTRREIYPTSIRDNFFLGKSPVLSYARMKGLIRAFRGGTTIQQQFLFEAPDSAAYRPGQEFTATRRQIIASNNFFPKFYYSILMDQLENLEVVQANDALNIARLLDIQVSAGISGIGARLSTLMYKHGQNVTSAGNFSVSPTNIEDRSLEFNGFPEMFNDGATPGPDGNVWSNYGGQPRSQVGGALNAVPRWMGTTTGATKKLTLDELYAFYTGGQQGPVIGSVMPDLILVSKGVHAGIRVIIAGQQPLIGQDRDPIWGIVSGVKFEQALIVADEYLPNIMGRDTSYGNNSTAGKTIQLPGAGAAYNAISSEFATTKPAASATLNVGDYIVALNSDTLIFDVAASPLFSMGFSGWMNHPLTTTVIGRIHFAGNVRCVEPRLNRIGYGLLGNY